MTTVVMIDASHPNKQESLYRKEMILKGHQNIHGEIIHDGDDNSNPIEAGWETSLAQHNNQSKPAPGCRQIIFKKTKLRMSCEPIDDNTRAQIYVHQEPCIFCRMFASRAAENLIQNKSNNIKDHFCPKHGNRYKPDDEIWKVPPKRKKKGDKSNKGGGKSNFLMLGKTLEKIIRDGKDPVVFRNKLDFRTRPFPAHISDDNSVNKLEIPLAEDPDYGKFFRRMKKCIKCEKEADERQKAKKGLVKCRF
jgi:hypothetical protein